MGKRNQQRRAEKQRRSQRRERQRATGRPRGGWAPRLSLEEIVEAAVEANWHQDPLLETLLAAVDRAVADPAGGRFLNQVLSGRLQRAVRSCWARGWQPSDLAAVVGRKLGPAHRRLCAQAIAAEARSYLGGSLRPDPAWLAQLEELGAIEPTGSGLFEPEMVPSLLRAGELRRVVELLGLLEHAPALPRLGPPPSEWGIGARRATPSSCTAEEARLLSRVRGLLTKAESTEFPEEAEALTTKAQELMARHAIDRAALYQDERPAVEGRRLRVEDPYAAAKAILLQTVAEANRCRSVWSEEMGFSTVFGPPDELRIADLLYTSLLTQATARMVAVGARDRGFRLPSFRSSFLVAYATRIGERLRESVGSEVDAGVARHGEGLLPVLARRLEEVDRATAAAFPNMVQQSMRTTNGYGRAAGRAAADIADLAVGERLCAPV